MRTSLLAVGLCAAQLTAQEAPTRAESARPQEPLTRPERTRWQETSTNADVAAHLEALRALPEAARLSVSTFGKTVEGRDLTLVLASLDEGPTLDAFRTGGRLRALIVANIHGGEVEGKEVVQILLREIAAGGHEDLLQHVDLAFVPVFNADGNDAIDKKNRVSQNGPDGGVGRRHNAQDLDLNRDFIKTDSPEARALIGLFNAVDPHLFMDLHTTNGTHHGYHLTYSPSLTTNQDADLDAFMHERFVPAVRRRMLSEHGFRIFDYGNSSRRRPGWYTYSHAPRLVFNYAGMRNRLSLLSEAYSYLPFERRAAVTEAFVLEALRELVARRDRVKELCALADARQVWPGAEPNRFGFASTFAEPVDGVILMGKAEAVELPGLGRRWVAQDGYEEVRMPIAVRFKATEFIDYPSAWAVVEPAEKARQALRLHGLKVEQLAEATRVRAEEFVVEEVVRGRRYEGHEPVVLRGALRTVDRELPKGTLIVPSRQRLARIAAQLLEAQSDDSLATWNEFDDRLAAGKPYPVLRLLGKY